MDRIVMSYINIIYQCKIDSRVLNEDSNFKEARQIDICVVCVF